MKLLDYVQELTDLANAQGVLSWDQDTHMPPKGAESRARTLALLERESHRRMTSPVLGDLAREALESDDEVTREAGKYWLDTYEDATMVPEALAVELAEATSLSTTAWYEATTFEEMVPHLERVVSLTRQYAACYPDYKPYDCLLDGFEPGVTQETFDEAFSVIKPGLLELRGKVAPSPPVVPIGMSSLYLRHLSKEVTEWMGYDYSRGNLAETPHPFMSSFGRDDVRIATTIKTKDPLWTLSAAIHEAGHAIYEQNANYTEWFSLDSSGLHESQSLFWEIMVGRSDMFWKKWFEQVSAATIFHHRDQQSVIRDLLHHDPSSTVRLEASDLDYGLHIMLRYEVEQDLFEHGMAVVDMKDRFNTLCKSYFGREPADDRHDGVLQDVHWACGMFGYFPSYLLGASFAAQLWEKSPKDNPENIRAFLNESVHQYGGRLSFSDVADKIGGYDPKPYLKRLSELYL